MSRTQHQQNQCPGRLSAYSHPNPSRGTSSLCSSPSIWFSLLPEADTRILSLGQTCERRALPHPGHPVLASTQSPPRSALPRGMRAGWLASPAARVLLWSLLLISSPANISLTTNLYNRFSVQPRNKQPDKIHLLLTLPCCEEARELRGLWAGIFCALQPRTPSVPRRTLAHTQGGHACRQDQHRGKSVFFF